MKSLLKYIKDYRKESILAPLFKMLEASFELLVPLVMAAIIDNGIANSAVFQCEGGSRLCHQTTKCPVFAYSRFVLYRA